MGLFLADVEDYLECKRKLRVLFVSNNEGACFNYRVKWMSRRLVEDKLIDAHYTTPLNEPELKEYTPWADVIVFQHCQPQYVIKLCEFVKLNNIPQLIVMEFDDDMLNIEPINVGAYRYWGTKEVKKGNKWLWKDGEDGFCIKDNTERNELIKKAVSLCDIVTVTTRNLAKAYLPYNKNVFPIGNYIEPRAMGTPIILNKPKDAPVVIGWQGGDSHYADIAAIMPALRAIKQKYKNKVHFKFMGCNFPNLFKKIDAEVIGWVRPSNFYRVYSSLGIDIGVIPLLDSPFNKKKSNIKWLENSYYRIPSVVAAVSPYKEHICKFNRNSYLYYNNQQLIVFLESLIDDPVERKILGGMARDEILDNWTQDTHYLEWFELYTTKFAEKLDSVVSNICNK
jgi:hypothetical protein